MTASPSDPNVRIVPQAPTAPVTDEVVETAKKLVRVRSFAKTSFEKVGVPVLIGAVSALVVTRNRSSKNDTDVDYDSYVTDTNE